MKMNLGVVLLYPLSVLSGVGGQSVRLCCPEGTAFKENADYVDEQWDPNDPSTYLTTCQDHPKDELVSKIPGIKLEGGEENFQCPENGPMELTDSPDFENITLLPSGELQVEIANLSTRILQSSEFCLSFTTASSDYETDWADGSIREVWAICSVEHLEEGEEFTQTFYPVMEFISSAFILITLVIYCVLKENRAKLFGKLTIGFLINVFFAFFFSAVHFSLNVKQNVEYLDTSFCKALGYIIQHFWIAFFFWMSAMAFNITKTFAQSFHHGQHDHDQTTTFILNILYAQGLPLIVTVVSLIMDNIRSYDQIVPNMGIFTCFIGQEYAMERPAFYRTPIFLYFYLIVSIIMVANLICFFVTSANLMSHWIQMKEMEQNHKNNGPIAQFRILCNLFIIMGIPWLFELISSAVEHYYDMGNTFPVRLTLDILNLLQGILIFIALACKVQVMKAVKGSIISSTKSTVTSKTSTSSLSGTRKASAISIDYKPNE